MISKKHFINVQLLDPVRVGVGAEGVGCGRGATSSGDCTYWGNGNEYGCNKHGAGSGRGDTRNTATCSVTGEGEG